MMNIISTFYLSITSRNDELYTKTLQKAIVLVLLVSVAKAFINYFRGFCALDWRISLVNNVQSKYYILESSKISTVLQLNPEQRISQDIDRLSTKLSLVFDNILITPVLILFYSFYLCNFFGWKALLYCYLYFIIGAILSTYLASNIIQPTTDQELFEGKFRSNHSHLANNMHNIILDHNLLSTESKNIHDSFEKIILNSIKLIRYKFLLNLFTFFHSYIGSIGIFSLH